MKNRSVYPIVLLIALLFLVACSGSTAEEEVAPTTAATTNSEETVATPVPEVEEPTSEPEPTQEPTKEPAKEPTAVSEPELTLGDTIRSESGGFAFQTIPNFEVMNESGVVVLSPPEDSDSEDIAFLLAGAPMTPEDTIESMLTDFVDSVLAGESFEMSSTSAITVGELTGLQATFTDATEDGELTGQIIALAQDDQSFIMLGGADPAIWESEAQSYFDAILQSVTLFEADLSQFMVDEADDREQTADQPVVMGEAVANDAMGIACFSTQSEGVSCLDTNSNWHVFTEGNSSLGGDWVTAMTACPDGRIWMAHFSGISIFDGENWQELADGWGNSSVDHIACDANGHVWLTYFGGVAQFDGSSWTNYEASLLATGEHASDLVNDIAIAPDGTVWTTTTNSIASFDGSEWTVYQPGQGLNDTYFFDSIVIDQNGTPWANQGDGLLTLLDGVWTEINSSDYLVTEALAVNKDNSIWVGTFNRGLYLYTAPTWSQVERTNSGLSSDKINTIEVDGVGRLWVGTEWGLNVFDGANWASYHMNTAMLADHNIIGIAVVGGGPALPARQETAVSTVTGSFMGNNVADIEVVICVEKFGSRFEGETPCSEQPIMFSTTTDANGRFTIGDVPTGYYVLAFNDGDGWSQITGSSGFSTERIFVPAGEEWDIGDITLEG